MKSYWFVSFSIKGHNTLGFGSHILMTESDVFLLKENVEELHKLYPNQTLTLINWKKLETNQIPQEMLNK